MRIFIFLLLSISLFATDYDKLLLRAQASMFPKIILLDKNIDAKISNSSISLSIIYNDAEEEKAKILKELIQNKYKDKLSKYNFKVTLVNIANFLDSDSSSAYYLFDASEVNKQEVVLHAIKNKRICFSYNYKDFKNHAIISLFVKEKTYIYLNKSEVNNYDIKFLPIFYKITKLR